MSTLRHAHTLAELSRDLDMVVYEFERPASPDLDTARFERARLRRELERLRDAVQDVATALEISG